MPAVRVQLFELTYAWGQMTNSNKGRKGEKERTKNKGERKKRGREKRIKGRILEAASLKVPNSSQVIFVSKLPSPAPTMACPIRGFWFGIVLCQNVYK